MIAILGAFLEENEIDISTVVSSHLNSVSEVNSLIWAINRNTVLEFCQLYVGISFFSFLYFLLLIIQKTFFTTQIMEALVDENYFFVLHLSID